MVLSALMAMANAAEKAVLKAKPRDEAHAGGIAAAVVTLVLKYCICAYATASLPLPRCLKSLATAPLPPKVSNIKEHITKLRDGPGLDLRASTMGAWRLGPQQPSAKR